MFKVLNNNNNNNNIQIYTHASYVCTNKTQHLHSSTHMQMHIRYIYHIPIYQQYTRKNYTYEYIHIYTRVIHISNTLTISKRKSEVQANIQYE